MNLTQAIEILREDMEHAIKGGMNKDPQEAIRVVIAALEGKCEGCAKLEGARATGDVVVDETNARVNSEEEALKAIERDLLSEKHLGRYAHEFAFRLNEGNVKRHTLDRLNSFVDAVAGKIITYQKLIA